MALYRLHGEIIFEAEDHLRAFDKLKVYLKALSNNEKPELEASGEIFLTKLASCDNIELLVCD